MKRYSESCVYFSSYAKLPADMPSGEIYKSLDVGLIINADSGEIEDASITLLTEEAKNFIKQIIVGYNMNDCGIEPLIEIVKSKYFGSSQKAICVTLRCLYGKYELWRKNKI